MRNKHRTVAKKRDSCTACDDGYIMHDQTHKTERTGHKHQWCHNVSGERICLSHFEETDTLGMNTFQPRGQLGAV